MSATTLPPIPVDNPNRRIGLLAPNERTVMGLQLLAALLAAGLLLIAAAWRILEVDPTVADIGDGLAALLVIGPVLASAWQSLMRPSLHGMTDLLIGLAVVAAWASGDLATAALLPIVMVVAHVLEERSLIGSREAIRALGRLTETTARRLGPDGLEEVVATASLRIGDRVLLRAGDRAPCDGTIMAGCASMDVSTLTGESVPVDVAPGDAVLAGSTDTNGALEIQVTSTGVDTTLGKIVGLLRDAERAKPPVTRLLEKYAAEYLALVLMIAAATWLASGNMAATLAVLVAACPCALVLAAPATSIAAIAVAARHGILIKSAAFLENLAEVTSVVFDKTGTLTTGTLRLVRIVPAETVSPETVLSVAGALGRASSHPVSRATAAAAGSIGSVEEAQEMGGFGMIGRLGADRVGFGRPDLFAHLGVTVPTIPKHEGPLAGVSHNDQFLGWLLFADEPRHETKEALAELRQIGLTRQSLLTGDRAAVARHVAAALDIGTVVAEALPAEDALRARRSRVRAATAGRGGRDQRQLGAQGRGCRDRHGRARGRCRASLGRPCPDDQRPSSLEHGHPPVAGLPPNHPLECRPGARLDSAADRPGGNRCFRSRGRDRRGPAAQPPRHGQCGPDPSIRRHVSNSADRLTTHHQRFPPATSYLARSDNRRREEYAKQHRRFQETDTDWDFCDVSKLYQFSDKPSANTSTTGRISAAAQPSSLF